MEDDGDGNENGNENGNNANGNNANGSENGNDGSDGSDGNDGNGNESGPAFSLHPPLTSFLMSEAFEAAAREAEGSDGTGRRESPFKIHSFEDLLAVAEKAENLVYPEIRALQRVIPTMRRVTELVGQTKLKRQLLRFFVYLVDPMAKQDEMLNLCFFGGPGMGKTTIARLIAEAFVELGILPRTRHNAHDKFIVGTRANMIAQFLGQTAPKTQAVIDQCVAEGKVLLLDEAYQFGNEQKRDSFAKELIDTVNQNLSEKAGRFYVILAGYKEDIQRCFFAYNQGLERRFNYKYTLDKYTSDDLRAIFFRMAAAQGLEIADDAGSPAWFRQNRGVFKFDGGDMETLVTKAKMAHTLRVFCASSHYKGRLAQSDLDEALNHLKASRKEGSDDDDDGRHLPMYN